MPNSGVDCKDRFRDKLMSAASIQIDDRFEPSSQFVNMLTCDAHAGNVTTSCRQTDARNLKFRSHRQVIA